jgi:hypothetical protein
LFLGPFVLKGHNTNLEETPHPSQTFTISSTTVDTYLPAGQNQTITVGNASLTFDNITSAGYVVQTPISSPQGGPIPHEYKLLGSYFDLTTTATYTGSITVTVPYDPNANGALKLWHWNGTSWQDITLTPGGIDTTNHTITGVTTSLSPFAVGELDTTPPTLTDFQLSPYVVESGSSSTISVNAQDGLTGVDTVTYTLTSSNNQTTTGSLSFYSPNGLWQATVSPATGVYAVTLTATDIAGNQSQSENLYLAVYDPSAGFVTGGGWITPDAATRIGVTAGGKSNLTPYRILCNGTEQKSLEARSGLSLAHFHFTPLHNFRYGIFHRSMK